MKTMSNEVEAPKRRYRVGVCIVKYPDGKIGAGYRVETLERRRWLGVVAEGLALIYWSKESADRVAAWLNDPKETAPEWNADHFTNAPAPAPEQAIAAVEEGR